MYSGHNEFPQPRLAEMSQGSSSVNFGAQRTKMLDVVGTGWQRGNTLATRATLWATASATTTTAGPSALPTETTTATPAATVASTTVQAGGLTPAWRPTWTAGITTGATAAWRTAFIGGRGTSWPMVALESATPSKGWRWRQDPGTF